MFSPDLWSDTKMFWGKIRSDTKMFSPDLWSDTKIYSPDLRPDTKMFGLSGGGGHDPSTAAYGLEMKQAGGKRRSRWLPPAWFFILTGDGRHPKGGLSIVRKEDGYHSKGDGHYMKEEGPAHGRGTGGLAPIPHAPITSPPSPGRPPRAGGR